MEEKVVAYIDLLGFSNHVKESIKDSVFYMNIYNTILENKKINDSLYPVLSYEERLQEIAKISSIDSIEYILPFSDLLFLMSSDCNSFIKQLGHFVLSCFVCEAHFYLKPQKPSQPEKGSRINYSINKKGELICNDEECNYWPTLFRGGIAFGKASSIRGYSIVNKEKQQTTVLIGEAVIEAVGLEKKIKGPRLIFGQKLYDQLDQEARIYCRTLPEDGEYYEILWPATHYIKQSNEYQCKGEINKIKDLIEPAFNLWKAYNHTPYSSHYFSFIELIIASTIHFFDKKCGIKDEAKEKVKEWMSKNEIEEKIDIEKY